jgi:hypothetical protein
MQMTLATDAEMLDKIEAFCAAQSIRPTAFGRMAIRDGNLVANLKAGRSLTLKTARAVIDFMEAYPSPQRVAA